MTSEWFTYIVRCSDTSLYAGVTTNLKRRLAEHNGKSLGAKYTRNRQPICLVYFKQKNSRSEACKYEYQLKQLTKIKKEALVTDFCQNKVIEILHNN